MEVYSGYGVAGGDVEAAVSISDLFTAMKSLTNSELATTTPSRIYARLLRSSSGLQQSVDFGDEFRSPFRFRLASRYPGATPIWANLEFRKGANPKELCRLWAHDQAREFKDRSVRRLRCRPQLCWNTNCGRICLKLRTPRTGSKVSSRRLARKEFSAYFENQYHRWYSRSTTSRRFTFLVICLFLQGRVSRRKNRSSVAN